VLLFAPLLLLPLCSSSADAFSALQLPRFVCSFLLSCPLLEGVRCRPLEPLLFRSIAEVTRLPTLQPIVTFVLTDVRTCSAVRTCATER
jgi:hypothetical protein